VSIRSRRIVLVAALLLLALGLFDIYARFPSRVPVTPLGLPLDTRELVLIFHGSGGQEEPALAALEQRFRELGEGRPGFQVVRYVWAPWSDNRYRSHPRGIRVGTELGAELGLLPGLKSLHLVAHSAGAYVLEPLCDSYREYAGARSPRGQAPATVAMTFLDPIGFAGVLDFHWGVRHLGACADYAEAFINTDDPAPATNAFLEQAWNVDVTATGRQSGFTGGGHRWPVQYYLDQLGPDDLGMPGRHTDRPRGQVAVPETSAGHHLGIQPRSH
jgi:hypothetical protein